MTEKHSSSSETAVNQPKSSKFWLLKLFVIVLLLGVAVAGYGYTVFKQFLESPISSKTDSIIIHIEPGSSAYKVAQQLHQAGFLTQPKWFVWYLRYQKKQHIIKAGEFAIEPQWNVDQLISELENPKIVQYPATIIAGQTIDQTLAEIQALPKIKKELDITDIKSLQVLFGVEQEIDPKYPYASLEGRLLPETYHYQLGDSDKDIVMRAFNASKKVLQEAWQQRDEKLPYKNEYEALIMASIVEKETGYAPERAEIAGVFVRRMNKGMRLQTDPTVIYGIGQKYDGNIRKKDLLTKTPLQYLYH